MALTLPKLTVTKKQLPVIVGGVVVVAVAGGFGWQYFAENAAPPRPPARKPQAVTSGKPHAPVKAAAPAATGLKQELDHLPERLLAGVKHFDKRQMRSPPA